MGVLECVPDAKPSIMRVTRLDENCQYMTGPGNSVTTSGLVTFTAEPEIEDGEETELTDATGEVCASTKASDRIKKIALTFEICAKDPDLLNILMCTPSLLNDAGDTIGVSVNIGTINCNGCFLEIWTQKIGKYGTCGGGTGAGQYGFRRYTFHKAVFQPGSVNLSSELAAASFSGYTEANPNALDGPFSDMPFVGDIFEEAGYTCSDDVAPPLAECGYHSTPVPADANDPTDPAAVAAARKQVLSA